MALLSRLLIFILLALAMPAMAADVVYPPGSRLGLAPPAGMITSGGFFGFEDRDNDVAIVLIGLPPEAYSEIEKSMTAERLKRQGVTLEQRESIRLPIGEAVLVIGHHEVENIRFRKFMLVASASDLTVLVTAQVPERAAATYPDAAIRATLTTVAVRASVPQEEQLSLLPFKVGELAKFKIGGILPGRAIMLGDPLEDGQQPIIKPNMIVAVSPGGPTLAADREAFARDVFASIPNLSDARLTSSESMRISAQAGHQIMANAKDKITGTDITIVQWLRFGSGGYLQMVGVAPASGWTEAYARFRSVRDGIEPK